MRWALIRAALCMLVRVLLKMLLLRLLLLHKWLLLLLSVSWLLQGRGKREIGLLLLLLLLLQSRSEGMQRPLQVQPRS